MAELPTVMKKKITLAHFYREHYIVSRVVYPNFYNFLIRQRGRTKHFYLHFLFIMFYTHRLTTFCIRYVFKNTDI